MTGEGAASAGGASVEVRDLSRRFGAVVALAGVSFDVGRAEIFGLIGPDGAGKTTLFRILTTLLVQGGGEARVLGCDVRHELWEIRRRVGYMPGRFSLYPDLSVEENLRFFASVFGTTVAAGQTLIGPIYEQIAPFRDRRAGALSGGMKQKLALSCALVHRPELLLLDEPTTGVDAVSRREFWELLADLRSSGLPILVSTPYMDEALRCDRVALMQAGLILETATPEALGLRYPYPLLAVRGVGGAGLPRLLSVLRALPSVHSVFPFGAEVHYADRRSDAIPEDVARELDDVLRTAGFANVAVSPVPPTIEDTFMALMRPPEAAA